MKAGILHLLSTLFKTVYIHTHGEAALDVHVYVKKVKSLGVVTELRALI